MYIFHRFRVNIPPEHCDILFIYFNVPCSPWFHRHRQATTAVTPVRLIQIKVLWLFFFFFVCGFILPENSLQWLIVPSSPHKRSPLHTLATNGSSCQGLQKSFRTDVDDYLNMLRQVCPNLVEKTSPRIQLNKTFWCKSRQVWTVLLFSINGQCFQFVLEPFDGFYWINNHMCFKFSLHYSK